MSANYEDEGGFLDQAVNDDLGDPNSPARESAKQELAALRASASECRALLEEDARIFEGIALSCYDNLVAPAAEKRAARIRAALEKP